MSHFYFKLGNDFYKMVYSDDSFINVFRFIKAWKRKCTLNRLIYFMLIFSFFILPIFGLIGLNLWTSLSITIIGSFAASLFFIPWDSGSDIAFDKRNTFFTVNGWNRN